MNKKEYLETLSQLLSSLPEGEKNEALEYYEEFFNEAGEENEQAVISSLGVPEKLAQTIINENTFNDSENGKFNPPPTPFKTAEQNGKRWSGSQIAVLIILLVISFPIWFSVLAAVFGTIFGLIIGFVVAAFGLAVASIACFGGGIVMLFSMPAIGLLMVGTGLILGGITALVFIPICKFVIWLFKMFFKGCVTIFNKITGRTEVNEA